jgi:hypothetical protein
VKRPLNRMNRILSSWLSWKVRFCREMRAAHRWRVVFGTLGHRGSATSVTFNEWHILAITQAIGYYQKLQHMVVIGPLKDQTQQQNQGSAPLEMALFLCEYPFRVTVFPMFSEEIRRRLPSRGLIPRHL